MYLFVSHNYQDITQIKICLRWTPLSDIFNSTTQSRHKLPQAQLHNSNWALAAIRDTMYNVSDY